MLNVASLGYSQTVSGSIGGTINDPTGAAVPGAKVTITNQGTGVQSTTVADHVGNYLVPFLPNGTYSVRIEAPGFKVFVRSGIILDVDQVLHIDATLQVGNIKEQVIITAAVPLLNTDNASQGNVIENDRIVNMPLNGRNFLQLTQLTSDVIQGQNSGWSGDAYISPAQKGLSFSADGQRDQSSLFEVDGANTRGSYLGTITLIPSIDTIQEFEVETASFSAQHGQSPVFVNVATKSGTNVVHGSAYEFDREAMWNAQNLFATPLTSHLPWHQHDFGGTFGGPVFLPHLYNGKDRTFFFFSYEGQREISKSPNTDTVPPMAFRQGNFAGLCTAGFNASGVCTGTGSLNIQLREPWTEGTASVVDYPGNVIPTTSIEPYMSLINSYWGIPQNTSSVAGTFTNDWAVSTPTDSWDNEFNARVDHHIRTNDQLYVRWANTRPRFQRSVAGTGGNPLCEGAYTQAGQNWLVGETHTFGPRMFNELRLSYNQSLYGGGPALASHDANFASVLGWGGVTSTVGLGVVSASPFRAITDEPPGGYNNRTLEFSDNLTGRRGRHSVSAGWDVLKFLNDPVAPGGVSPPYGRASVTFGGTYSGYAYADLMLGYPASGSNTENHAGYISPPMNYRYPDYNFYVQDDWKFSRRFTLNMGMRYELVPVLQNASMRSFLFDPSCPSALEYPNCVGQYSPQGVKMPLYGGAHKNFGPRLGFAWQPFEGGNTVVRAGYGYFYSRVVNYGPANLADNAPAVQSFSMTNSGQTGPTATTMANFLSSSSPTTSGSGWSILPNFRATPASQVRSFSIQHQFPAGFMLDVSYRGVLTIHEDGLFDNNSPVPDPGPVAARRPYPAYGSILTMGGVFNATYNGGTIRVEKRMDKTGLSLLASYTWSKSIDQLGTPYAQSDEGNGMEYADDRLDFGLDKGLSGVDIPRRVVFSYMYQLPIGRGKHFLSHGGVLSKFIGDWSVNGITTFSDGEYESVQDSLDPSNTGEALQRPDRYCNGNWPLSQRSTTYWFDSSCYGDLWLVANPTAYRYGDDGRSTIIDPGINNWDIAILKDIPVNERVRLQFRAEAFDTFNHQHYGDPNGTMNDSTFNCVGEPCEGNFPTISSAGNPRQIQFALKLLF
jgi:hypothetical protein